MLTLNARNVRSLALSLSMLFTFGAATDGCTLDAEAQAQAQAREQAQARAAADEEARLSRLSGTGVGEGEAEEAPVVIEGNVEVNTQAEVDALAGVTRITGNLRLNGSYDIQTLAPLASLETVDGNLASLTGLVLDFDGDGPVKNRTIGGDLNIIGFNESGPANLDGLGVPNVGGNVRVTGNPQLTDLTTTGLPFAFVGDGSLFIGQNPLLPECQVQQAVEGMGLVRIDAIDATAQGSFFSRSNNGANNCE